VVSLRPFRLFRPWSALLDVLAPENCILCGVARATGLWCARGVLVPGLRPWDETHLCRPCAASLDTGPLTGRVGRGEDLLPVWAATSTSAAITSVLGAWKYRGVRGLAWPLGALFAAGLWRLRPPGARCCSLVPVPLHRSRRRDRGFNQSEVLARLVARDGGPPLRTGLLRRVRATAQQAKLDDPGARAANLRDAFGSVRRADDAAGRCPLIVVDDVVTSGATVLAAAGALREAGWTVAGVLALAAASAVVRSGRVDTSAGPA